MNSKEQPEIEISKLNTDLVTDLIGEDPKDFELLLPDASNREGLNKDPAK